MPPTVHTHYMHNSLSQGQYNVQHDPYKYLLTESEKQYARSLPFRFAANGIAAGGAAIYYLSRHQ